MRGDDLDGEVGGPRRGEDVYPAGFHRRPRLVGMLTRPVEVAFLAQVARATGVAERLVVAGLEGLAFEFGDDAANVGQE